MPLKHKVDSADTGHTDKSVNLVAGTGITVSQVPPDGVQIDVTAGTYAPSGADYLVGTANGGLSAEIAVGTTPGGELGNTWASPTVDATHSGSSHADYLPWEILILPQFTAATEVGTWTISGSSAGDFLYSFKFCSSMALDDSLAWPVVLAAGTWDIEVQYESYTHCGIMHLQIDGGDVGTIDGYAGGFVASLTAVSGISVATTGKKTFRIQMHTKNGSSSAYAARLVAIRFRRTA